MMASATDGYDSWLSVSSHALRENARALKAGLRGRAKLGVVVKSDAYGHGLALSAAAFLQGGADWLIVNSAAEALALRACGIVAPVYVCGRVSPPNAEAIVRARARVVVYDRDFILALAARAQALGSVVPVHLKLETGTHRQGVASDEALALAALISQQPSLQLEGLSAHFSDIEDSTQHEFADEQRQRFAAIRERLHQAGFDVPMGHLANSAATLLYNHTHADLVRVGIAAYGLWPSRETYATWLQRRALGQSENLQAPLKPALSWRARLAQVKDVHAGAYDGYGRSYRTTSPSRLAIVPVGYFEGYDRRLSNVAHVLIAGQRAPVRGRICMNMFMVDVTHIPNVAVGAVATLLGRDGEEEITAETLAGWMGTIHYEACARIHSALPRIDADTVPNEAA